MFTRLHLTLIHTDPVQTLTSYFLISVLRSFSIHPYTSNNKKKEEEEEEEEKLIKLKTNKERAAGNSFP